MIGLLVLMFTLEQSIADATRQSIDPWVLIAAPVPQPALDRQISLARDTPTNRAALIQFLRNADADWISASDYQLQFYSMTMLLRKSREMYAGVQTAPPYADHRNWPGSRQRDNIQLQILFNERFERHVRYLIATEPFRREYLDIVLAETKYLGRVLETLNQISSPHNYPGEIRLSLAHLKYLLGDEAYAAGTIPPSVPTWRFNEMDE